MSHRPGTARSAHAGGLVRGLLVSVGLVVGGPALAETSNERLPPEYGAMRSRALAPDFAAGGALIGGVAIPLLVAIPAWDAYTGVTQDSVIDSQEGKSVATGMIVQAELIGIGAGTGLAVTGWLLGGGYRTGRWHWALLGGLGGSAVGAGAGTALGLLTHRPWTGRTKNASGEREWVLGYSIGLFTLTTVTAVGTTAGVLLGGGKVEGKRKSEVQLVLGTQRDIEGRSVTTPSLRGRF